jgi:hypothetical protein
VPHACLEIIEEIRKQLIRDAVVGFVLGIVVVSAITFVTWTTCDSGAQAR